MPYLKSNYINFVGRLCLATTFAVSIPTKIIKFPFVVDSIISRGIPDQLASFLLLSAIICLSLGSLLLVIGQKQRIGSALLLIFLVPTTIIFHVSPFQPQAFYMNIGLIGALLILLSGSVSRQIIQPDFSIKQLVELLYQSIKELLK